MLPFGQVILSWRVYKGLTQEGLARKACIPRPNLSAIEQGKREVTLKTLRMLAAALGIQPGILVDGLNPYGKPLNLTREKMERIAQSVVKGKAIKNEQESWIAKQLSLITSAKLRALTNKRKRKSGSRAVERGLLNLAHYPSQLRESLIARVIEGARK